MFILLFKDRCFSATMWEIPGLAISKISPTSNILWFYPVIITIYYAFLVPSQAEDSPVGFWLPNTSFIPWGNRGPSPWKNSWDLSPFPVVVICFPHHVHCTTAKTELISVPNTLIVHFLYLFYGWLHFIFLSFFPFLNHSCPLFITFNVIHTF